MKAKNSRIVLSVILMATFIFLAACSTPVQSTDTTSNNSLSTNTDTTTVKPAKQLVFGMVYNVATPFYNACDLAAKDIETELGIKVLIEKPEKADVSLEIKAIENFIALGVDGIIVNVTGEGVTPIIDEAIAKGIPVITYNSDTAYSKRLAYYGTDQYQYGVSMARYMAKMMGNKGNVIGVAGMPTSLEMISKTTAFKDTMAAEFPDIKVLDLQFGYSDPAKTLAALENMFQANIGKVDGVVAFNASAAGPLAAAVKEVGKGNMIVLADHDNPDTIQFIRDGVIDASQVQKPYKAIHLALTDLYNYVSNGTPFPSVINSIDTIFITKDTLGNNYDANNNRIVEYKD